MFSKCLEVAKSASLISIEKWVLFALKAFVSDRTNAPLARLLLDYSTPKPRTPGGKIEGIQFSETLLGALLSLSILPKTHAGPYEFFDNTMDAQSTTFSNSLSDYVTNMLDDMYVIIKGILCVGGDVRTEMLEWIGLCLHSNAARGQIWNTHSSGAVAATTVAPDSFMLGLCGVLLRLSQPLLRPTFKVILP